MPTKDELSIEESFWPFGPTGEAVASFDTSGFFSGFGGATNEDTESSTFEIEEGPIQGLGLWNHITGGLAAIMGLFGAFFNALSEETINSRAQAPGTWTHITGTLATLARALIMVVMLHYAWLTLGSFLYNQFASTNTSGQPETFGGITNAEDGLALAVVPAAEKWNRGSNSLVSVMVDSGASGHYFDDALIPGLRYRLENYQELAIGRWRGSTIGEGEETTISSPGRSPKQPLPGMRLHDPLHGRQACPEFIAFDEGVSQTCPRLGLFLCHSLPNRDKYVTSPPPPQSLNWSMDHNCRGASTGGGRPGTASGPHHRCPRGATPNPNISVDCAWLRAEPLLG